MSEIYTPTRDELERRISRYGALKEMTTRSKELARISQEAVDVIFARKLMPVILDDTKNPLAALRRFTGPRAPRCSSRYCRPGRDPACTRNGTYETFIVLEGCIEYHVGEPITHRITLDKWDAFSCPPFVYRGFRNVGTTDAVQLTVITGVTEGRDDVSMPDSIAQQVRREHGEPVLEAFKKVFRFDPPPGSRS